MRKSMSALALSLCAALTLCACGNSGGTGNVPAVTGNTSAAAESSDNEIVAEAVDTAESPAASAAEELTGESSPEDVRRAVVERSLFSTGNKERFRKVFAKAERGEEITVAYIGGSITAGYTLEPEEGWAYLTHKWLCEKYPEAKINYVNAGISGTPSSLGLMRSYRDIVTPYGEPDIVFIDFSVNDDTSLTLLECYESLVRTVYDYSSEPAVALMFFRTSENHSCAAEHGMIGDTYGLPMISVTDALTWAIDEELMTWSDYSDDEAHPNVNGALLTAEMVEYMLECEAGDTVKGGMAKTVTAAADTVPLYGGSFTGMKMLEAKDMQPVSAGEFKLVSEKDITTYVSAFDSVYMRGNHDTDEGMTFELTFDDLFIVYQTATKASHGTAEIYVDGVLKGEARGKTSDGWYNPKTQLVMRGTGEPLQHTVTVKMKDGSEKANFFLFAFGYTE